MPTPSAESRAQRPAVAASAPGCPDESQLSRRASEQLDGLIWEANEGTGSDVESPDDTHPPAGRSTRFGSALDTRGATPPRAATAFRQLQPSTSAVIAPEGQSKPTEGLATDAEMTDDPSIHADHESDVTRQDSPSPDPSDSEGESWHPGPSMGPDVPAQRVSCQIRNWSLIFSNQCRRPSQH